MTAGSIPRGFTSAVHGSNMLQLFSKLQWE